MHKCAKTQRNRCVLQSQFEELMKRFVEFKQPIGLEEKAERIARETAEMENSVDELTGLEANACISALDHARQIGRRIAQVGILDICLGHLSIVME